MLRKLSLKTWLWGVAPAGVMFVVRLFDHWRGGYIQHVWVSDVLLIAGWVLGWMLVEGDRLFYGPKMREALKSFEAESIQPAIRNMLTAFVMTGVGIWVISSSSSLLAAGTCLGFAVRLFSEIIGDGDYQKWYWVFARQFTREEHRGLMIAWGLVLIWLWQLLVRG
jgi:hypothetical protein